MLDCTLTPPPPPDSPTDHSPLLPTALAGENVSLVRIEGEENVTSISIGRTSKRYYGDYGLCLWGSHAMFQKLRGKLKVVLVKVLSYWKNNDLLCL